MAALLWRSVRSEFPNTFYILAYTETISAQYSGGLLLLGEQWAPQAYPVALMAERINIIARQLGNSTILFILLKPYINEMWYYCILISAYLREMIHLWDKVIGQWEGDKVTGENCDCNVYNEVGFSIIWIPGRGPLVHLFRNGIYWEAWAEGEHRLLGSAAESLGKCLGAWDVAQWYFFTWKTQGT